MRVKPLIAIPLIAIALAGCSAQQPAPQASTVTAEEKPLFATDEEALAAAQAAYAHYLEVSDQIARDGGANPESLKEVLSSQQYELEASSFKSYVSKQIHSTGQMSFDSLHIASLGINNLSTYLCLDSSQSRVIDNAGIDVTPSERVDRWPLLVSFETKNGLLIVSGSETWPGTNFC
jgi:hypothetical protein